MITSGATAQKVSDTVQPAEDLFFELLTPPPFYMAQADMDDSPMTGPGGRFGQARRHYMDSMDQQRKHLEQFRLLKLLELLDLDEDKEIAFLTTFKGMRKDLGEVQEQRLQLIEELVAALKEEKIEQAQVDRSVQNLLKLDLEKNNIMENFLKEARAFLNPEQMGKFIVFQERFEFQLLEKLKDFQGRKRGEKP